VGVARRITAVEAGGRTRVVINLARLVGYDTRVQGNEIILTLAEKARKDGFTTVVARGD
jgi:type IV pilus assembly protein PilQ